MWWLTGLAAVFAVLAVLLIYMGASFLFGGAYHSTEVTTAAADIEGLMLVAMGLFSIFASGILFGIRRLVR